MNIIMLMIPMALLLGAGFLYSFFWANSKGQFDDLETPAHRMLLDENERTEREHIK
ncbi:cbb3-type cytochrome oxidase assembly protein CcoS [Bdellovibrio sp. HCB209]|uniref:cbb3-type cytochrome oxidase assembly protein CcoS n=1 Tax=Bdellovibrio sp. HCB209 TaxID=3394354 RepID=UPI0039B6224B